MNEPHEVVHDFQTFVQNLDPLKPHWTCRAKIREDGLRIYIRKVMMPHRLKLGCDFELATLDADQPGAGALTRFLDRYEKEYGFFVESIHNPRLYHYLLRRGYVDAPNSHPVAPCVYKPRVYKPRPGFAMVRPG